MQAAREASLTFQVSAPAAAAGLPAAGHPTAAPAPAPLVAASVLRCHGFAVLVGEAPAITTTSASPSIAVAAATAAAAHAVTCGAGFCCFKCRCKLSQQRVISEAAEIAPWQPSVGTRCAPASLEMSSAQCRCALNRDGRNAGYGAEHLAAIAMGADPI